MQTSCREYTLPRDHSTQNSFLGSRRERNQQIRHRKRQKKFLLKALNLSVQGATKACCDSVSYFYSHS